MASKYPAVSAFASIRVALGPARLTGLPSHPWYLALTSLSMLFSKQTNKQRYRNCWLYQIEMVSSNR